MPGGWGGSLREAGLPRRQAHRMQHGPVRGAAAVCLVVLLALAAARPAAADVPNATYNSSPLLGTAVDRDGLLALKTGWTNWEVFAEENQVLGWNESLNVCEWTGVYCLNSSGIGRVFWIDLGCDHCAVELEGTLVSGAAEYNLTEMRRIEIDGNTLTGGLPDSWGDATAWPALRHLDLSTNKLNGSLPQAWASGTAFGQLKYLNLSYNTLGGSISAWDQPAMFASLTQLDLRQNNISGSLPGNWSQSGAVPQLATLNMVGNQLSGSLPASWGAPGSFLQLVNLDLGQNAFTGGLPAEWGSLDAMPWLKGLSLYGNQLSGGLPYNWGQAGNLANLSTLLLDTNFLTGDLPDSWSANASSWPSLSTMGLSSNALSGDIPATWGTSGGLQSLVSLYLMYNKLSGFVPGSLTLLPHLSQLWLRPANYALCGALPPANFTVCTYQGGACAATSSANFTSGCGSGSASISSDDIQAVVRLVGYGLNPFTTSQQGTLQVTLYDVLPHISSQANVVIESFQAVTGNPTRTVDLPGGTPSSSSAPQGGQSPAAAPPMPPPADQASAAAPYSGERRRYRRALLGSSGQPSALGRRLLQLPSLTPSVAEAAQTTLEAVDVTLLLVAASAAQALDVAADLSTAVVSTANLQQALQYRGLNATDTQLLYSSGGAGSSSPSSGTAITGTSPKSKEGLPDTALAGILVACTVVAVLAFVIVSCVLWRRYGTPWRSRRKLAVGVKDAAPSDTGSDESIPGALTAAGKYHTSPLPAPDARHETDTQRTWPPAQSAAGGPRGTAGKQSEGGATFQRPSLVFPPLDIAERGIDLDMENLFRTAGAGSDPVRDDGAAGGPADDPAGNAMALPQARTIGCD